ncbi:TIGR04282 family arsenosugar biosynthesis glycosyltransferase [Actinomycetospora sp. CA-101289]|uniref:TIGR04282 family arsenosugar biosynthesis glycosyltransferase n=1 Tax=Actinomycetospora sp. CA-101289 TaxID=3239893 RepID=UPI003D995432
MRTSEARARVVLVLAKAPVAGRVKTRLMPVATPEGAAGIAAAALLDTLEAAAAVPGARVVVALEGDPRIAERADEIGDALAGTVVVPQRGHTLGERITAAHDDVAAAFPGAASVQIGMDTPQVDAGLLADALHLVADGGADAALGLALDGGWWALALADPRAAAVIAAVPTSRDDTGARTLAALRAGHPGLDPERVLELPPLSDVDTPDDAVTVADLVPTGRFARAVADQLLVPRPSSAPLLLPVPGGLPR